MVIMNTNQTKHPTPDKSLDNQIMLAPDTIRNCGHEILKLRQQNEQLRKELEEANNKFFSLAESASDKAENWIKEIDTLKQQLENERKVSDELALYLKAEVGCKNWRLSAHTELRKEVK